MTYLKDQNAFLAIKLSLYMLTSKAQINFAGESEIEKGDLSDWEVCSSGKMSNNKKIEDTQLIVRVDDN